MAKIDCTFTMPDTPQRAQARFVEDIAPELHRKADVKLYKEEPGHLAFSDGLVDPSAFTEDGLLYAVLRRESAHRIKVDFEPEGVGTRVRIHGGSSARDICQAIERLGEPGHWPNVARDAGVVSP